MMEAGGPDPAAGADDRRLSALSELLPQPPSPRRAGLRGLPSVASLPLLSPRGGDQCLAPSLPTHFHPPLHSSLPPVWSHVTSIRLSLESHLVCDPRTLLHVSKVTSAVRPPKRFLAATRFVAPPFPRRCPPSFPHVPHTIFHVACCTFIPPAMLLPDAFGRPFRWFRGPSPHAHRLYSFYPSRASGFSAFFYDSFVSPSLLPGSSQCSLCVCALAISISHLTGT